MKKLAIVLGTLLGIIILIITGLSLFYWYLASSMKSNWESDLRAELTATDSFDELNDSISSLGVMLGNKHGNWIAIDYRDNHNVVLASKAVVRMKDGTLLESDKHFCGSFAIYANYKQMWESEQESVNDSERWSFKEYCAAFGSDELLELESLESAQDPQAQQALLIQLGFVPIPD